MIWLGFGVSRGLILGGMRGYADSSTTRADCSKAYEQVTVPLVHFLHIGLDSSHYDTSDSRNIKLWRSRAFVFRSLH
jgi:hypothetical protein